MFDSWMLLLDIMQTRVLQLVKYGPFKATKRRIHISFHEKKDLLNQYLLSGVTELLKLLVPDMKRYW
jgi:hypothetical protein